MALVFHVALVDLVVDVPDDAVGVVRAGDGVDQAAFAVDAVGGVFVAASAAVADEHVVAVVSFVADVAVVVVAEDGVAVVAVDGAVVVGEVSADQDHQQ